MGLWLSKSCCRLHWYTRLLENSNLLCFAKTKEDPSCIRWSTPSRVSSGNAVKIFQCLRKHGNHTEHLLPQAEFQCNNAGQFCTQLLSAVLAGPKTSKGREKMFCCVIFFYGELQTDEGLQNPAAIPLKWQKTMKHPDERISALSLLLSRNIYIYF